MKPTHFYVACLVPVVAWVAIESVLSAWQTNLNLELMPTLPERLLLFIHLWLVRAMPFGVLAAGMAAPLVSVVAAFVLRPTRNRDPLIVESLRWVVVSGASWLAAMWLVMRFNVAGTAMVLFWSASIAQGIFVALCYRIQAVLRARGITPIPALAVLGLGMAAQVVSSWACWFAAAPPAWAEWRENARRRPTTRCS